jgi:hypothetical protein
MAVSFGAAKLAAGGLQTPAGTVIVTGTKVYAERIATSAGTYIFSTTTPTKLNPTSLSGYKVCVPILTGAWLTNVSTFASLPGHTSLVATGTGKSAYIPWAGSILGIGVRSSAKLTGGHVTFTAYNGSTALGAAVTLNTTNFKAVNGALAGIAVYAFTANNLKLKVTSSADYAPNGSFFSGALWIEV